MSKKKEIVQAQIKEKCVGWTDDIFFPAFADTDDNDRDNAYKKRAGNKKCELLRLKSVRMLL